MLHKHTQHFLQLLKLWPEKLPTLISHGLRSIGKAVKSQKLKIIKTTPTHKIVLLLISTQIFYMHMYYHTLFYQVLFIEYEE